MVEVISIKEMRYEDWLKLRKTGIGGSDAAALCGLNPFASAIHVFQDKTSAKIEIKDNESMRQGSTSLPDVCLHQMAQKPVTNCLTSISTPQKRRAAFL